MISPLLLSLFLSFSDYFVSLSCRRQASFEGKGQYFGKYAEVNLLQGGSWSLDARTCLAQFHTYGHLFSFYHNVSCLCNAKADSIQPDNYLTDNGCQGQTFDPTFPNLT